MKRLRIYFLLFFLLLAIPFALLLNRSYANLNAESFLFHRRIAESVVASITRQLGQHLRIEEARSYTEYRYLHVPERSLPSLEGLNLSPLSKLPVESEIPGTLGYFQIDPDGSFHTPLLPDDPTQAGLMVSEIERREILRNELLEIVLQGRFPALSRSDSAARAVAVNESGDSVVPDAKLLANLASSTDLKLQQQYVKKKELSKSASSPKQEADSARQQRRLEPSSERQALVFDDELRGAYREQAGPGGVGAPATEDTAERARLAGLRDNRTGDRSLGESEREGQEEETFPLVGAEVDPFHAQLVARKWIVLERKVWWQDRRYIQGLVVRLETLGQELMEPALRSSALPTPSSYLLFYEGDLVLASEQGSAKDKPLLLESANFPPPFSGLNLALTVNRLPTGAGRGMVNLIAVLGALMIMGGVGGIYRLTATHWQLSRQQKNFVSAISHELKSPLTSIRMYGEMLMEGWVKDEQQKQSYYRHIHDEGERLGRLMQNVLSLSQLERKQWEVRLTDEDPAALISAQAQQLEKPLGRAGFEVVCQLEDAPRAIRVDRDALTQILINLTDNAVKFAEKSELRRILITLRQDRDSTEIGVRDFGPGIPRREQKRIFQQFYRVGSEMTRTAPGSGIGLALVKMLMESMGGRVQVSNRSPGAEFRLIFKCPHNS